MNQRRTQFVSIAVAATLSGQLAFASPSGLNNIPTADTAPNLTLVLQEYSTFGADTRPDHVAGFKFGIDPWEKSEWRNRFEVGLDGHLAPGSAGPEVLQLKYATQPFADGPALGVGVANLAVTSDDRGRVGQPFSYAVLSQDLQWFRLHGGYALQTHNQNTPLLGVDKSVQVFNRNLMLRADAIQTAGQHNWAASVGGLYAVCRYFVVESWMTQPVHHSPPTFTVKVDFVAHF
jgi:hypothetical protein